MLSLKHRFNRPLLSWFAGFIIGINLIGSLLLATITVLLPQPVDAQTTGVQSFGSCMGMTECSPALEAVKATCSSKEGCCVEERCFVLAPSGKCLNPQQGYCYSRGKKINLSIKIGDKAQVVELGDYILTVYNYALSIAAFIAAVMILVGGFQYMTAGGGSGVSKGKERILNAVIGLILAFGAYLLLSTINPDLTELRLPKIPIVKRELNVNCAQTELCVPCGESYQLTKVFADAMSQGKVGEGGTNLITNKTCDPAYFVLSSAGSSAETVAECTGKSCTKASKQSCPDFQYRCRQPKDSAEKSTCNADLKSTSDEKAEQELTGCYNKQGGFMKNFPDAESCLEVCEGACDEPGEEEKNESDATDAGSVGSGSYGCFKCSFLGQSCSPNGTNDACCSGVCMNSKCGSGRPGDYCEEKEDCLSNICQTNGLNSCATGGVGSPCANDSECKGLVCEAVSKYKANNACVGAADRTCYDLSGGDTSAETGVSDPIIEKTLSCPSGMVCASAPDKKWRCVGAEYASQCRTTTDGGTICYITKPCANASDCGINKYCYSGMCHDGSPGKPCSDHTQCAPPPGSKKSFCNQDLDICTDGSDGTRCYKNHDCLSSRCYMGGEYNVCTSGGPGSRCDNDSHCNAKAGLRCYVTRCEFMIDAVENRQPVEETVTM